MNCSSSATSCSCGTLEQAAARAAGTYHRTSLDTALARQNRRAIEAAKGGAPPGAMTKQGYASPPPPRADGFVATEFGPRFVDEPKLDAAIARRKKLDELVSGGGPPLGAMTRDGIVTEDTMSHGTGGGNPALYDVAAWTS